MKKNNVYFDVLKRLWDLIKKASIAIISGVPPQKFYLKRNRKSNIIIRNEELTHTSEKHYHRPISKPAVEKQTLLKETKKQKGYRPYVFSAVIILLTYTRILGIMDNAIILSGNL
jgi:hypothetical protein